MTTNEDIRTALSKCRRAYPTGLDSKLNTSIKLPRLVLAPES